MITQIKRNNVSSDVAADISLEESLSFAGLLCIQDQFSKLQSDSNLLLITHEPTQSFDFELSSAAASPKLHEASPPRRNSMADEGNLSPQTMKLRSNQANATMSTYNNLAVLLPLSRGGSKRISPSNSIRRNGSKKNQDTDNNYKKDSSSFIGKIFKPCRICNAVEPTAIRQETIPAKQMKSH